MVAPARRRRSRTSSDSVARRTTRRLVQLLEPGAHAVGLADATAARAPARPGPPRARSPSDGAQVAGIEAVALQVGGGGHHGGRPRAGSARPRGDQPELLETADELLLHPGRADQLAEARSARRAGAHRPAAGPLASALGGLLQLVADHAQRQELVALQAQDRAQALDVLLREQAIAPTRALRVQKAPAPRGTGSSRSRCRDGRCAGRRRRRRS